MQKQVFIKSDLNNRVDQLLINIRKERESKNYSQEYLAAKLFISQKTYSKVELGIIQLTLSRLFYIAEVLELSMADLIEGNQSTGFVIPINAITI